MIAKTLSALPLGFNSSLIEVEGDKTQGLPAFNIVGMARKTVSESRERVKSAIRTSGFSFPDEKLTINLAPADLEKEGTSLDLPIAINILILSGQLRQNDVDSCAFSGELSLDAASALLEGSLTLLKLPKTPVFLPSLSLFRT